jgi:anthranilate synthase component I
MFNNDYIWSLMYPIFMAAGDSKVKIEKLDLGLTPAELYDRLSRVSKCSFLLESAVGSERTVSYSFMGFRPEYIVRCVQGQVEGGPDLDVPRDQPIAYLNRLSTIDRVEDARFPFLGGLVGYFSYDFARFIEPSTRMPGTGTFPDFELGMYREGIIFDHSSFQAYYFSVDGANKLKTLMATNLPKATSQPFHTGEMMPLMSQERYEEIVSVCRERISAGEAFQIVASRSLSSECSGNSLDLYRSLRQLNPSPYMFYFDFDERVVLGSSPETLVTVRKGEVITYPIAGTRPLGRTPKEKRAHREDMLADEKERAEHCMLVDLARNDVGRVCEIGSVHVPTFMQVEEFSHVQHMVSKVQGTLEQGKTAFDAFCAVFPAGTVSGAPKPRAMEIIQELEQSSRGPYAGAVGYISLNGNLDSAIAIRSAFIADDRIYIHAGAGIVADSDPAKEYVEAENKLMAVKRAIEACNGKGTA